MISFSLRGLKVLFAATMRSIASTTQRTLMPHQVMNDKLLRLESLHGFAAACVFAGHFLHLVPILEAHPSTTMRLMLN